MATVFKIVLRSGKTLSAGDFPEGAVVSVEATADGIVHVIMRGRRADAEAILFGLKESICFFGSEQEFDEVQAGATFLKRQSSLHSAVCETAT